MDDLFARHKTELKELLAKVQAMKHAVPKGDKKKKKQVLNEITLLEADMKKRHQMELEQMQQQENCNERVNGLCEQLDETDLKESLDAKPKMSKAQRKKERKQEEEREREKRIAEGEIENKHGLRNTEAELLSKMMLELDLSIKEICPDGNCLYNAVADQLTDKNNELHWKTLRSMAANQLRDNKSEFLPFMTHPATGEPYTADEFYKYCDEVEGTNAWGGQLEIQALSQALKIPVEIFQANSPILRVGEQFDGTPIRISYHRHAYGLGEHYNSVVPKETENQI